MVTLEKLQTIKVLYRAPDTLALYGIPYEMRPGQSPRDLQHARDSWTPAKPGHYGSKQVDLSDWIFLGYPGSRGTLSASEGEAIAAYLAEHSGLIPGGPCEWSRVADSLARRIETANEYSHLYR
jgi:hypothetical protein